MSVITLPDKHIYRPGRNSPFPSSRYGEYNYSGSSFYTHDIVPGLYKIECLGAQGGGPNGGLGGYSGGYVRFTESRQLYVYPGQQPSGADGGWLSGGKSTNASYRGGGGMSHISTVRYVPPVNVVEINERFTRNANGLYTFPIGTGVTSLVSITLTIHPGNHDSGCVEIGITRDGILVHSFSYNVRSSGAIQVTYTNTDTNNIWAEWGVRANAVSGHSPQVVDITLTGLTGVESQAGNHFEEPTTRPLIVAGGGGGQGPLAGSPGGSNTHVTTSYFQGLESPFGGSGAGFNPGRAGTASQGPGGGSNYAITAPTTLYPNPVFNHRSIAGVRAGNGLVRIIRIGR